MGQAPYYYSLEHFVQPYTSSKTSAPSNFSSNGYCIFYYRNVLGFLHVSLILAPCTSCNSGQSLLKPPPLTNHLRLQFTVHNCSTLTTIKVRCGLTSFRRKGCNVGVKNPSAARASRLARTKNKGTYFVHKN